MRLCVVFAVVAVAFARADVSELLGYKYAGPAVGHHHHHASSSSSQYASQFGPGQLEVIPLNLAHVSTTVHKGDGSGFGKGSAEYSSGYSSSSQYSSGSSSDNLGGQFYSSGANLGAQYYAPVSNQGVQYSSGANLGGHYSSGAQYSGAQQYSSGPILTSSPNFVQSSGFSSGQGISSGIGGDSSFSYHQLINDVLSGKYTVGSYSPSAYSGSYQKQKININLQPNAAPVTYRHVYFAEAPAEAPVRPRIHIEGAIQPKKHVKVVFIKTPDQGGFADQELTLPQLEEEKTQIYVLSKEHNHQPQINIKAAHAGPASRPEIFFLKYRNEAEALKAQQVLRDNAGKDGFTAGAVISDAGLSSGSSSGFTGGQSSGVSSSGFNGGLISGLSSSITSGASSDQSAQSGSSNAGYAPGLSTGLSSGFTTNSASSFQSGSSNGGSFESVPLKEHNYSSSGSSSGVTSLYGAPSVGNASSGGYTL